MVFYDEMYAGGLAGRKNYKSVVMSRSAGSVIKYQIRDSEMARS